MKAIGYGYASIAVVDPLSLVRNKLHCLTQATLVLFHIIMWTIIRLQNYFLFNCERKINYYVDDRTGYPLDLFINTGECFFRNGTS